VSQFAWNTVLSSSATAAALLSASELSSCKHFSRASNGCSAGWVGGSVATGVGSSDRHEHASIA